MAKTFGIDSWGQIEAIRYTWNIDLAALNLKVSHKWEWEPKTGKVSFEGKGKDGTPVKVNYLRSQVSSQPANVKDEVDPAFNNDMYWLIFPFHAIWDTSADVQDKGKQKLPLGQGTADQVIVKYPAEAGGFTPGDTWELYLAIWDTSADVQDKGKQKLPLGQGTADQVIVKYPAEAGGFTPGDTWELYLA